MPSCFLSSTCCTSLPCGGWSSSSGIATALTAALDWPSLALLPWLGLSFGLVIPGGLPCYGVLITFSECGKRYKMGRYQVGPTTLYISRELGLAGLLLLRLRCFCPPKVTLIALGH